MALTGITLGGFARGQQTARNLALDEQRIGLAEEQLGLQQFQADLEARKLKREEAFAMQQEGENAIATLQETLLNLKSSYLGGDTTEFTARHAGMIRGMLAQIGTLYGQLGQPNRFQTFLSQFAATPTKREETLQTATLDAEASVAGQAATEDALIAQGIDPATAQQSAFDLPKRPDSFRLLTPAEVQASGFAPGSVVQMNQTTGQISPLVSGAEGGLDPSQILTVENNLRDDFDRQSVGFEEVQRQFFIMQDLAGDATGLSDVALTFSFFKVLDPGSRVTEGEFATTGQAMGLGSQLVQALQRLDSGEILPDDMREAMVQAAQASYEQFLIDQRSLESHFTTAANEAGVSPANVVRSRIRESGLATPIDFSSMSLAELGSIDLSTLSADEKAQLDAELEKRGF